MVPLTILTGFLGAGKTTLLNHLLQGGHGLRVAVMVNDFGAINIDAELIADVAGDRIDLANGCICCTIRDDLRQATLDLLAAEPRPEYILVEASGVSDPAEVARTFMLPELAAQVTLDGIIAVVDAEQIRQLPRENVVLAMDQIGVADIVVLNKADLVPDAQLATVTTWIRGIVPRARILPAVRGAVPPVLLLGVGLNAPGQVQGREHRPVHVHALDTPAHGHNHALVFETWAYQCDAPLDWPALEEVLRRLPPAVFRAKGLAHLAKWPARRCVVQVVGPRVEMTPGSSWGNDAPGTRLVFIATAGTLQGPSLREELDRCRADHVGRSFGERLRRRWRRDA